MPQPTTRFNRQICDVLRYCTSPHARTISRPVPPVAPKQEPSCSISSSWCERRGRHGLLGQPRRRRVRTSYPLRAPYPRLRGPSILHSRPQTFLRQAGPHRRTAQGAGRWQGGRAIHHDAGRSRLLLRRPGLEVERSAQCQVGCRKFSARQFAHPFKPNGRARRRAWATLIQRLGYTRYVAQGGDWGNAVSEVMALQQPPGLLGIHTNMAATVPADVSKALSIGGPPPAGLSADEKRDLVPSRSRQRN
jgi:hypothetical protein